MYIHIHTYINISTYVRMNSVESQGCHYVCHEQKGGTINLFIPRWKRILPAAAWNPGCNKRLWDSK